MSGTAVSCSSHHRPACRLGHESTANRCLSSDDTGPKDTAERRQITVMFTDLVGSMALSAQMDPEDLREVISAYQQRVANCVHRFDGFVAKYMGDGVLVYFPFRLGMSWKTSEMCRRFS